MTLLYSDHVLLRYDSRNLFHIHLCKGSVGFIKLLYFAAFKPLNQDNVSDIGKVRKSAGIFHEIFDYGRFDVFLGEHEFDVGGEVSLFRGEGSGGGQKHPMNVLFSAGD